MRGKTISNIKGLKMFASIQDIDLLVKDALVTNKGGSSERGRGGTGNRESSTGETQRDSLGGG